jgi:hypothetical protein
MELSQALLLPASALIREGGVARVGNESGSAGKPAWQS